MSVIKTKPIKKSEQRNIRLLIWMGVLLMILFIIWFVNPYHVGNPTLFWLLTSVLGFRFLRMLHEWYHYYHISIPVKPKLTHRPSVDVLTTACPGEPCDMIINTLEAIQAIKYPHTTYLCDEGNDPVYIEACKRLGVIHVTRTEKVNAKAGNINNALRQATGEICLILDPDHVPHPDFLDRVVPYFEDPELGYVQVVQAYYNHNESLVAQAAAEQTYHFYGPIMMSMNHYGTAQAIGANCTFRRKALDSIGGHAAGLAEDMHTAMQLHAKGWKSVYVPEVLSKGLVPATLPSYYKQQLKWSRGTFELFYTTYFKLFRHFTRQQKLHYFTLPLYYLFGLFNFIEILVPALALVFAVFPWNIHLGEFLMLYLPLFFTSMGIRQYAQRWLMEEHERGFHLIGGIIRTGTWWIYTLGLIYTIIRKKIPYIPTAKDDKPQNNFLISIPNILACLFSLGAIVYNRKAYGSDAFFHPFNLLMIGFALTNVAILGTVVMIGQEKFMISARAYLRNVALSLGGIKNVKYKLIGLNQRVLHFFRTYPLYLTVAVLLISGILLTMTYYNQTHPIQAEKPIEVRNKEPFFTGIYLPDLEKPSDLRKVKKFEEALGLNLSIISIYQAWGPESINNFPAELIRKSRQKGAVTMISWEPWTNTFPELSGHPELGENRKVFKAITDGVFDAYLQAYSEKVKELEMPLFIRFAHEPENPQYPWSTAGENTSEEYIAAWQYVVGFFRKEGADNVLWVWNPWKDVNMNEYYPGGDYVDWVGITLLNYGEAATDGTWHSFAALYEPFRYQTSTVEDKSLLRKPVMLAEFGTTPFGGDQKEWLDEALYRIGERYPEIKAVVFFYSDKDKNWPTQWRPSDTTNYISWTFRDSVHSMDLLRDHLNKPPFSNMPDIKSKEKIEAGVK